MNRNNQEETHPTLHQQIQGVILSQLALAISLVNAGVITADEISASIKRTIDLLEKSVPDIKRANLEPLKTLSESIELLAGDEKSATFSSAWFAGFNGSA